MSTERLLQICVTAMAALATLMLGTSQDSTTLPVIALVVTATSLIFTDFLGWFHLHRYVAGVAGLIAGINAFFQSQTGGLETQFISVANLLIHLQIILLFQQKTSRIYWQLITLSLLQVVVAAALNLFVLFGPLLVLYTAFAVSAMLLFFILRETTPYFTKTPRVASDASNTIRIESMQPNMAAMGAAIRPRRMLVRLSYMGNFIMLSFSTVLVSASVFLLMPRFGDNVWRAKSSAATGVSNELDLTDVGTIYESPALVMRISFVDQTTGLPYSASGYPYFRGGVLDRYQDGKWRRRGGEPEKKFMSKLAAPTRIYSAVRQKVNLEPARDKTVYAAAPACRLDDTPDSLRIANETSEIIYFPENNDDPLDYSIGTLGFRNGLQSEFIPMSAPLDERREARHRAQVVEELPALAEKAAEIVAGIPESERLRRVRKLEAHFTDGTQGYKYSLDPSPDRDRTRDPVEDFVVNHKTGHCQFYASALALMLRSQGIPARIVTGYRADTFNVVGAYYQIREMDAHAWVEAAIPADQVPDDEILPTEGLADVNELGAWVRLDPTPGDSWTSQSVAVSPWRQKLSDSIDYMQLLWSEYVLGLNEKRQRKAIYEPIQNAFRSMAALVFSREIWAQRWEAFRQRFEGEFFTQENVRDGVIAVVILTLAFYTLRILGRFLWRFGSGKWNRSTNCSGPQFEFYRRFEAMLAKRGIRRDVRQTPKEFAALAAERLKGMASDHSAAEIPSKIVDLFYQVRFGQVRLDTAAVQRLENWLGILQQSLKK